MTEYDLKGVLLHELDYAESPGLGTFSQRMSFRPISGIDNVYFIQDVPIVYFCQFNDVSSKDIWELYHHVWNQSKVPLLYVIMPEEIRIYNGYAEPPETPEELNTGNRLLQSLKRLVDIEIARREIHRRLYGQYNRLYLETGAFWSTADGQSIKKESRADQRLLKSMDQVRIRLNQAGLSPHLTYALLGRSIFIRYLEDRGILTSDRLSQLTGEHVEDYRSSLNKWETAYKLFEGLSNRFHGDLFPIDDEENEREIVQQIHLNLIGNFLDGYNFDTNQRSFWPFDFKYVPIELISGIYDTFLYSHVQVDDKDKDNDDDDDTGRKGRRKILGAYYTPLSLVDFVIEETLPIETTRSNMKILDPACGSGVFLVRAYQRLVEAWKLEHNEPLTSQVLSDLLKQNIFGVDVELNAVRIAGFSLYLTMLDYLDNEKIIEESFSFPNLKHTNLIHADFFSKTVEILFLNKKFDRVIGNLPWGKGTLRGEVIQRIAENGYQVGGKQIVQVFLQYAPRFCAGNGELALIAPAKSTILVTSNTHETFRQMFFQEYHVRAVVNFSALVYELFPDSLSPVIALFYQSNSSSQQNKLVYGVPKPSALSQHLGAIILDSTEIKYLDREELLAYPVLWKVASWGTARDAVLIQRLKSLPTLKMLEQTKYNLEIREGFIIGNRSNEAEWLYEKTLLDTKAFEPYIMKSKGVTREKFFERPREPKIFTGPLALIHKSSCKASFVEKGFVAYRDKITGVIGQQGQENLLKWLVAYINSPLARYYHFLTSTSWAVERGTIIHDEYKDMPFLVPHEEDSRFKEVIMHIDQIIDLLKKRDKLFFANVDELIKDHEMSIANLIFNVYNLSEADRQLVKDLVNYEIEYFYWMKRKRRKINDSKAKAIRPPDATMLREYSETFVETTRTLLRYQNQTLNTEILRDGLPLSAVGFELVSSANVRDVQFVEDTPTLRSTLQHLDKLLLEQRASTLYMRRHVRIYDGSWLYFVRPSERRFWTRSQARADADSFILELLDNSRKVVGAPH